MKRNIEKNLIKIANWLQVFLKAPPPPNIDLELDINNIDRLPANPTILAQMQTQKKVAEYAANGIAPRVFYRSPSYPIYHAVRPYPDSVALAIDHAQQSERIRAIGRIGYPRVSGPSHKDKSLGTGILITPRHVLTNRHVFENSWREFISQGSHEKCGIEFLAHKDEYASEFHEFVSDELPIFLEGLDVAIFTLKTPSTRTPIPMKNISADSLVGREVESIGFPDPHNFPDWYDDDLGIYIDEHVYGENAEFAVKYTTHGQIFRPEDLPINQNNFVYPHDEWGDIPSFCHNTSNLSGNSGSPILDRQTGEFLGVHYRSSEDFHGGPANLAMPTSAIIAAIRKLANPT